MRRALLMVDMQNDFMPGGTLAVPNSGAILAKTPDVMDKFDIILASKDWHPTCHASFVGESRIAGIPQWPKHCVMRTFGSQFPSIINEKKITQVFYKGMDFDRESFSIFSDVNGRQDGYNVQKLHEFNLTDLYIMGVATEYCVWYTVFDLYRMKFPNLHLISDMHAGINPETTESVTREIQNLGVKLVDSASL